MLQIKYSKVHVFPQFNISTCFSLQYPQSISKKDIAYISETLEKLMDRAKQGWYIIHMNSFRKDPNLILLKAVVDASCFAV